MSIEIKKTGKNTYYRKDGNKMGGKKEKQEIMNISIKYFEKDMAVRYRASSKFLPGWGSFGKMLSGGIKRGGMAVMSACCVMPGDEYRNNIALAAMHHVDRSKVVMIGMEHEFDHTDRLAEEFKHHMDYMSYFKGIPDDPKRINMFYGGERPNTIMIDEVPYNPMDEFDRPDFYRKDIEVLGDGCGSVYPKNPLDVLSEQFKIDINNTHQKDVTNAINNMINVNKAYSMVIDNEGSQLYPETNMCLEGVSIKNVDNSQELFSIDLFKDSLNKYFNYNHYVHINTESLVKVIDDILSKDNKEVLVIDKEEYSTYFSKTDNRYKSVIVNSKDLEIRAEEVIFVASYTTIQESLLKLLESIKGNEEFLITYKRIDKLGICGIISIKEWYMKKSKITLIIPDWMIEPKDVYTYMSGTGISDEEREDTLSKRLDKLLEGTYYKPLLMVKIVPDQERTMLYKIAIVKDNGGPCLCNLEDTTFYSKLEALAESYYILRKNGLKTTEELKDVWKENNIGRGNIVPEIHTISKAELLFLLEKEMIDGSSYQVLRSTNEEGTDTYYNIEYNISGKKSDSEKELLHTWCKTEYEALNKFYTYLCQSKENKNV